MRNEAHVIRMQHAYDMQNQDITCIHAPINMPTIWLMSSTCHMQGIGTYFMHLTCV